MSDLISRQAAIDALRYAQHRFTVADEAGGMGTVKWSEDVIYFAAAERVLSELPPAQPSVSKTETVEDCISRQAAIAYLMTNMAWYNEDGYEESEDEKLNAITDLINGVPSAEPEPQWIPCSERLPEVGKDVMVCYDFKGHRSVLIGVLYDDEKFHGYDDEYLTPEGRKYRKAVAWMPLPEPYREERTEE